MRLWNIGAEGQLLLGAWGASAVVLVPAAAGGTPGIVLIPAMMLAGAAGGRRLGPDPRRPRGAARRQRDHRHADAQLRRPARGSSSGSSGRGARAGSSSRETFPDEAWLPRLTDLADAVPALQRPDGPPRVPVRAGRGGRRVARAGARRAGATRSGSSATARRPPRYAGIDIKRHDHRACSRHRARSPGSPG